MKLLTKEITKKLPPLRATDGNDEAKFYVKFFALASGWSWYACEFDGEDTFFGLVDGHELEWGYFSLKELQEQKWMGIPRIERDMWFTPISKRELEAKLRSGEHV